MDRITIFDTTLRDGEQSPGASMTPKEKLQMAHELSALGVDVIEAGFAASSVEDAEAIRAISREVTGVTVAALARATHDDIARAAVALEPAERGRIHVFIATSNIHLERKLGISKSECLARAVDAVAYARSLSSDVEFTAEDATRTDIDFLCEVVEAAASAGATTINIPDTVGYALPTEIGDLITTLFARVPALRDCVVSTHCHDDLGMAVANSLAAVAAGARQVECTINGIGERAGNAALEEIVMAMAVRARDVGCQTGVVRERLYRTSRLFAHLTGIEPQPNKAIVGRNAFAHEAGIHQHGVINDPRTYEIMTPEAVGAPGRELVLGKHSGRHGLEARYRELGYSLTAEQLQRVGSAFAVLAAKKKNILDEDLISIFHHGVMDDAPALYRLSSFSVQTGDQGSEASVILERESVPGGVGSAAGDGPIAAVFAAMDLLTPFRVVLQDLTIRAATPGRDALGEVSIHASIDGQSFSGRGSDTDVVRASALAYLHAVNKAATARRLEASHLESLSQAWGV